MEKFPYLLIFHERYGDRYFLISNPEDEAIVFCKIFNERVKAGYYYISRKPTEPVKPIRPSADASDEILKKYGRDVTRYENYMENYRDELVEYELVKQLSENQDPFGIMEFMHGRCHIEYESYSKEVFANS